MPNETVIKIIKGDCWGFFGILHSQTAGTSTLTDQCILFRGGGWNRGISSAGVCHSLYGYYQYRAVYDITIHPYWNTHLIENRGQIPHLYDETQCNYGDCSGTAGQGKKIRYFFLTKPAENTYIIIEPGQTAKNYIVGQRQWYYTVLILSGSYLLIYVAALGVLFVRKRK